jgi:putative transcriptional regulator
MEIKMITDGLIFDSKEFESLEGKMLIASRLSDDTCFAKSVIYLYAHDENGAIGIIINQRIGSLNLKDAIKFDSYRYKKYDKAFPVVFGGPVESSRFIILSLNKSKGTTSNIVRNNIKLHIDCDNYLNTYISENSDDKFLVAKGVAVWESSQLESEIAENSWIVAEADADLIFSQRIKNKWDRVIKNIGVKDLSNLVSYTGEA